MSILVNRHTRVLCQGITGKVGLFHSQKCREYGTQMVGGVTPGKGGNEIDGFPVFNTVEEAVLESATSSVVPSGDKSRPMRLPLKELARIQRLQSCSCL